MGNVAGYLYQVEILGLALSWKNVVHQIFRMGDPVNDVELSRYSVASSTYMPTNMHRTVYPTRPYAFLHAPPYASVLLLSPPLQAAINSTITRL